MIANETDLTTRIQKIGRSQLLPNPSVRSPLRGPPWAWRSGGRQWRGRGGAAGAPTPAMRHKARPSSPHNQPGAGTSQLPAGGGEGAGPPSPHRPGGRGVPSASRKVRLDHTPGNHGNPRQRKAPKDWGSRTGAGTRLLFKTRGGGVPGDPKNRGRKKFTQKRTPKKILRRWKSLGGNPLDGPF